MESEAGEEALSHAAYHGQWYAVRLLIDKEVDVKSAAGRRALRDAAWHGQLDIAKLLIDKGVVPRFGLRILPRRNEGVSFLRRGLRVAGL